LYCPLKTMRSPSANPDVIMVRSPAAGNYEPPQRYGDPVVIP
jgi:hypothetical protein